MAQRCRDSSREVCKHKIIQNDKLDVHTDIVADVAEFVRISRIEQIVWFWEFFIVFVNTCTRLSNIGFYGFTDDFGNIDW